MSENEIFKKALTQNRRSLVTEGTADLDKQRGKNRRTNITAKLNFSSSSPSDADHFTNSLAKSKTGGCGRCGGGGVRVHTLLIPVSQQNRAHVPTYSLATQFLCISFASEKSPFRCRRLWCEVTTAATELFRGATRQHQRSSAAADLEGSQRATPEKEGEAPR